MNEAGIDVPAFSFTLIGHSFFNGDAINELCRPYE